MKLISLLVWFFTVSFVVFLLSFIQHKERSLSEITYESNGIVVEFNEGSLVSRELYDKAIKLIIDSVEYKALNNKNIIIKFMSHDQFLITAEGYEISPRNYVTGNTALISRGFSCSGNKWYKIYVRPKDDTIKSPHQTALFHEFFQHLIPHDQAGDWNINHFRQDMLEKTIEYGKLMKEIYEQSR